MTTSQARARTKQKLQYAAIHTHELADYKKATSNDDWENAHQESCFLHLAGAVDAILHEINESYSLGLDIAQVDWWRIAQRLAETGQASPAFVHCVELKRKKGTWLNLLFEWRNNGAHRRRVGKIVCGSGDNQFKDPRSGRVPDCFKGMGCQQVLQDLAKRVRELVDRCRNIDQRMASTRSQSPSP